jgi:HAD superfamily hydrolase (TIGR01484 family)
MRYLALATDYDGTLAEQGTVSEETLDALRRLRESGRRLLLVTGRELDDLRRVFPQFAIFDRIVAENGALLFCPETREERPLAEAPPAALVERLKALGVQPLSVGRVIIATWSPHEQVVLEAIHALGLELQVIFNKGAVMVLPSGVNKAFGLRAALAELALSAHNTVSVGDAENDHALLAECELGIAVENALPMLKERADCTTREARGAGVRELIAGLLASDLRELEPRLTRHDIALGADDKGTPVVLHPYGRRVLLCGASGSGKSTFATAFLEALVERAYQFCLVDPEGDFGGLDFALALGDEQSAASVEEVATVLRSADKSVIASLLALPLEERSAFLLQLFARCAELRARTGRPHWFVIDEAHHMLPESDIALPDPIVHAPSGLLLITVHPDKLASSVLRQVDTLIVVGPDPHESIEAFAAAVGATVPASAAPSEGQVVCWSLRGGSGPVAFTPIKPKSERRRHDRKYAAGALGEDKSFYFRGPDSKLNLRAHNLMLFLQIGDGVDDGTWTYHLRKHDYSDWVKTAIKNDELAQSVAQIESDAALGAGESRKRVRAAIEKVYTLPA